jgi:ABC-2 type transport system permease protein
MNTIATLTKSSLKMFVRNKQALFFTLFTPLIIMGIFGLIGFDRAPKMRVGIVSHSPNAPTREFIESLKQVPVFEVTEGNEEDEAQAISDDKRSVVFWVPDDFIPEGTPAGQKSITAIVNGGEKQEAETAVSIVAQILDKVTFSLTNTPALFSVQTREVNVQNIKYIDFLLPGVVALAVMQMSVFSVAFVFVDYKEKGILKRLLATPIKPYQFVSANVATRILVSVAQAAVLIAVGVLAFNAHVVGSYALVLLIVLLGATMFLGLGFAISGLSKTVEAVPAIANLVVFPMLFLGGTFFPIDTMPPWLQSIAKFLPLTYFSESLRDVMTKNAGFSDIQNNLLWMLAWSVVLVFFANVTFSFEEKRA